MRRLLCLVIAVMAITAPAYADGKPVDPLPPGQPTVAGQVVSADCQASSPDYRITSSTAYYYSKGKLKLVVTTPYSQEYDAAGDLVAVEYVTPKGVDYVSISVTCGPGTPAISDTITLAPGELRDIDACVNGTQPALTYVSPDPLPEGVTFVVYPTNATGLTWFAFRNDGTTTQTFTFVVACRTV